MSFFASANHKQTCRGTCYGEAPNPSLGLCICELVKETGLLQSRISYHMKELKEAGLVTEVTRGRWNYYYLNKEVFRSFIEALQKDFEL